MPGNIALPFCKSFYWNQRRAIKLAIRMQSVQVSAASARQTCLKNTALRVPPFPERFRRPWKSTSCISCSKELLYKQWDYFSYNCFIWAKVNENTWWFLSKVYNRTQLVSGLYSLLLPPNFSFVLQQVFFHQGPAEQIPFGQFAISPPPFWHAAAIWGSQ